MIENRLLTDEMIADIYFEKDTVLEKTPLVKKQWIAAVKKNGSIPSTIAEKEHELTRTATLREVEVEFTPNTYEDGSVVYFITKRHWEELKQGKHDVKGKLICEQCGKPEGECKCE